MDFQLPPKLLSFVWHGQLMWVDFYSDVTSAFDKRDLHVSDLLQESRNPSSLLGQKIPHPLSFNKKSNDDK